MRRIVVLAFKARVASVVGRSAILLALGFFAGCSAMWNEQAPQIGDGNSALSRRDYVSAHQYFADAAKEAKDFSPRQLRQVMDGLCLSEYHIGPPSYTAAQQLRTCADALNQPDSESGPIYSDLARKERATVTETINVALAQHDIAAFDEAAARYRSLPGSDPEAVEHWSRQAWTIVDHDDQTAPGRTTLARAISQLSPHFPKLHNMSDWEFRSWVEKNMMVGGITIMSNVEIGRRAVGLWLGDDQIRTAEMNLDRLTRINNGLIVRCHCNAHTNVALGESGLPVYLVRLDAATRQSEVLILH